MVESTAIIKRLQDEKLILLMGAPGTGKTRILNQIAEIFENGGVGPASPVHIPSASVPIPARPQPGTLGGVPIPMLLRQHRKVFRMTLHQNSHYRDFVSGIVPKTDGSTGFTVSRGRLYEANEFAKQPNSAALLIIDEINRGPVIEVFGASIAAIEADKRLGDNNQSLPTTCSFSILNPNLSPASIDYQLSPHLYILAAMNQADVSVAPIDIAFLRRWGQVRLAPDYSLLRSCFNISDSTPIPDVEDHNPASLYAAAAKSLEVINGKIIAGRGEAYQLGHGIFLSRNPVPNTYDDACGYLLKCWHSIYGHIEELFFGDVNAIAYIVNADQEGSPYATAIRTFAGTSRTVLLSPELTKDKVFSLYKSLTIEV